MFLGMHVKCLISLLHHNQIWNVRIEFNWSLHCQISQKSLRWKPH